MCNKEEKFHEQCFSNAAPHHPVLHPIICKKLYPLEIKTYNWCKKI